MRVNYPAAGYDADDVMRIDHRAAEFVAELLKTDDVTTNGSKTSDVIEIY